MNRRFHHRYLAVPRTACPTMSGSLVYVVATAAAVVLIALGSPATTSVAVPLMIAAGAQALRTTDRTTVIAVLRAILAAAGPTQGGAIS